MCYRSQGRLQSPERADTSGLGERSLSSSRLHNVSHKQCPASSLLMSHVRERVPQVVMECAQSVKHSFQLCERLCGKTNLLYELCPLSY